MRLGAPLPFARAAAEVEAFRRVSGSRSTVRRQTEKGGAAYGGWREAEVDRGEREEPDSPTGPEKLLGSVDGAMIPRVGGEGAEVKTGVLGEVIEGGGDSVEESGEEIPPVMTENLSSFSRLADAETFGRQAPWETPRRGLPKAKRGAAVAEGAEGIQGFIDFYRPDAVRILDFPHAAQRVSDGCEALDEGKEGVSARLKQWKQNGPHDPLVEGRKLSDAHEEKRGARREPLGYLEKRERPMHSPLFLQAGGPWAAARSKAQTNSASKPG